MVALFEDVMDGGVMFCPDCPGCAQTWSADGHGIPRLPAAYVLAAVRAEVFTEGG